MTEARSGRTPAPTVSVVMATYNGGRHVGDQLSGIVRQTVPVAEVVIADDGSSDGTVDICRAVIEQQAPEIRLVVLDPEASPLGPAANFERGLRAAQGDLVLLADQDDLWHTTRVEAAVKHFETHPEAGLVAHDAQLIDAAGGSLGRSTFESMGVTADELAELNGPDAVRVLNRRSFLAGMTFALRRRVITEALPIPAGWPHDYWLAYWAACTGQLRVVADASHLAYRQHESNVVGAGSRDFSARARRLLSRPSDAVELSRMFAAAESRMREEGAPEAVLEEIRHKAAFEARRTRLPDQRWRRIVACIREARRGEYARLASNGNWNVLRDVLHRPAPEVRR
ncbi:hypothetical protein GCM10028801_11810 [Nocardioides maradonensis]